MTKNVYLGDSTSLLWASQVALVVKDLPASAGDWEYAGSIPGQEDPLE